MPLADSASVDSRRVYGRRFRTELCASFMSTGHCKYHNRCMYAHGPEMLRTEEQNLADHLNCESAIRAWAKNHRPSGRMSTTPVPRTTSPDDGSGEYSPGSPANLVTTALSSAPSRPMSDSVGLSDNDADGGVFGVIMRPKPKAWRRHDPYDAYNDWVPCANF